VLILFRVASLIAMRQLRRATPFSFAASWRQTCWSVGKASSHVACPISSQHRSATVVRGLQRSPNRTVVTCSSPRLFSSSCTPLCAVTPADAKGDGGNQTPAATTSGGGKTTSSYSGVNSAKSHVQAKPAGSPDKEGNDGPKSAVVEGATGGRKSPNKTAAKAGKTMKREEAAAAAEAEARASSADDPSTAEVQTKKERLLDAEKRLLIEEIFTQDEFQQYFHTTEVSTVGGLRWLDVSASPAFFDDPFMANVPEGQFFYTVIRKLFGTRFPVGLYSSVANGPTLPATYVDENWACLVLRSTKEVLQQECGGSDDRHDHRRLRHRRWALSSILGRWWHDASSANGDDDKNNSTRRNNRGEDYVYDELTDEYYPRRVKMSQQWAQSVERRLRRRRLAKEGATAGGGASHPAASNQESSSATDTAAALLRNRAASNSTYRPPLTMSDFTDRLTIFIGKELHPVEKDPDVPKTAAPTAAAKEALTLSLDVDHLDLSTQSGASNGGEKATRWVNPAEQSTPITSAAPSPSATNTQDSATAAAVHYEVRWRVVTVHRSPITFIRDMQSQWNKLTSRGGRRVRTMRSVPALSHGLLDREDVVKQALRRAARPASAENEEDEDDYSSGSSDVHNTMVDRVTNWEDLVRLLFHGAAHTLQESAHRNTRRLEMLETEIFEASNNSRQHLNSMTRLMAELHLLSREATIDNAILRESKVAYQKLKRVLDHPVDLADQRELLYVDSVLSISAHLEEQSESLLFLQFSVAMNQTEQHLRTLTIFNTLFIPLEFICSCGGSDIFSSPAIRHSQGVMYSVFGLMAITAVVTLRWIRRNLR
jgi:hypothetical protein